MSAERLLIRNGYIISMDPHLGDIPAGETWSGYPARPHREALRSHAALFKLSGMMRKLEALLGERG